MRTDPSIKFVTETKAELQFRINAVTRKVAIGFVIVILVFFFIKMLVP